MPEELGKIEKPSVEEFQAERKLFFVPMVLSSKDFPLEFLVKVDQYWDEVESQVSGLESKLGPVNHIFHELIPEEGESGLKLLKDLNLGSYEIVRTRFEKGAKLEAIEDNDILTELTDWSRCLSSGLQNQKVFSRIYGFYTEINNQRNEHIAKRLNDVLKPDEIGILIMAEGHHVQFPADIRVFYVAPPSLDGIKRWLRDYEAKIQKEQAEESQPESENPEKTSNP